MLEGAVLAIEIANIYATPGPPLVGPGQRTPPSPAHSRTDAVVDTVEVSSAGRALARAVEDSSFSMARVRSIRAEIASGTYETQHRIEQTAARLLDTLG